MLIYKNNDNWLVEDQLNFKLVEKIDKLIEKNLNNLLKQKDGYSTKGENVEQYWFKLGEDFYFKNHEFETIINEYKSEIISRLKKLDKIDRDLKKKLDLEVTSYWTVIGEENSYHTLHNHNAYHSAGITTVLYLKVPQTNIKNQSENNLFAVLNSNIVNECYEKAPRIVQINPEVGKLLIFPSWILHGTYPQSKGTRQTFNLDFMMKYKKHNKNFAYN